MPNVIFLGDPAKYVYSKVKEIEKLEEQYKIIDWIDDVKSNQLGQLHAIYNVSTTLQQIISNSVQLQIVKDIQLSSFAMHERINSEHNTYHSRAEYIRSQINSIAQEIKNFVNNAISNIVGVVTDNSVKVDQGKINSMRSKLIIIINDNIDIIDNEQAIELITILNKLDYNVIDQTSHIDRTTDDPEMHKFIDNSDHKLDIDSKIYLLDVSDEYVIGDDEIGAYIDKNINIIDNFLPITNDDIQNFIKCNITPYNAIGIAIYNKDENGNPIGEPLKYLSIEKFRKTFGKRLYRVGLCSDIHYNDDSKGDNDPDTRPSGDGSEYHTDTRNFLDFYQNKQEVEFICCSGDIGTNSINHDRNFKLMLNKYASSTPFFSCYGNHDYCAANKDSATFGDEGFELEDDEVQLRTYHWNNVIIPQDDRYITHHFTDDKNSELYANYWFEKKIPNSKKSDIYFFLSVDYNNTDSTASKKVNYESESVQEMFEYVGNLNKQSATEKKYDIHLYNPDTLIWFKNLLETTFKNKRVFVFTHLFFPHKSGTYNGLNPGWYSYGKDSSRINVSNGKSYILCGIEFDFLNKLNNEYPNTIWFTGHSHYSWEWQKVDKNINITNSEYKYVHPGDEDFSSYSEYRYLPKFDLTNITTPYKETYYKSSTANTEHRVLYAKIYPNSSHYGHNVTIHGLCASSYTKGNDGVNGGGNPGDITSCYLYVDHKSDSTSDSVRLYKEYFRIDEAKTYMTTDDMIEFTINCTLTSYDRLEIGIYKEKVGTNWHVLNILSVYDNDSEEYIYSSSVGSISFNNGISVSVGTPSSSVVPKTVRKEAQINQLNTAYNVHLPSTCRPIPLGKTSYGIQGEDSEGAIMDVYEDYVDIRGIIFKNKYQTHLSIDNVIYDTKAAANKNYINKYYALAQYRIPIKAA